MAKDVKLTRKEAIRYLDIEEKHFDNYHKSSGEIIGVKGENKRWYFDKKKLKKWNELKSKRLVELTMKEYRNRFRYGGTP